MAGINWDVELDRYYPDPQQNEEVPVYMCAECKGPVWEGDEYFYIEGEYYCVRCTRKLFRFQAER